MMADWQIEKLKPLREQVKELMSQESPVDNWYILDILNDILLIMVEE